MTLPRFAKVQVDDETLNRVQDRIKVVTDALVANQLLEGRLVTVTLTAGAFTQVTHGLGRQPQGYIVVRLNANAVIWDQPNGTDANAFLYLQPSATVTATLWVF
jgi:hypothetical protein